MAQHLAEPRIEPEMTLVQWAALDEDEPGELVDGRLVEEEDVGALHDAVAGWLVWAIKSWLGSRGGFVLVSDTRFGVAPRRGRKPDTSVYFPGRKPPAQGLVTTPPDIMIEVVSPRPKDARRDRIEKSDEYAAFGVRFYWIVDPAVRTFEVFELGSDGRYVKALGALGGVLSAVPGCEGLTLDLDALWAEVSRLEDDGGEDPAT
ncbi:MAG: Uma2 family endonuclease [Byssovorax sp.]